MYLIYNQVYQLKTKKTGKSIWTCFCHELLADPELGDQRLPEIPPGGDAVPPNTIAHYEIGEKIGAGGMGTVYRGR